MSVDISIPAAESRDLDQITHWIGTVGTSYTICLYVAMRDTVIDSISFGSDGGESSNTLSFVYAANGVDPDTTSTTIYSRNTATSGLAIAAVTNYTVTSADMTNNVIPAGSRVYVKMTSGSEANAWVSMRIRTGR